MAPDAFVTDDTHNAYQNPTHDGDLPGDHVRNLHMRTRVASTAYDELKGTALRTLYDWDGLVTFIGAVLGYEPGAFHRLGDPLGAASINIFRPGWNHAWHFDEAEYTT